MTYTVAAVIGVGFAVVLDVAVLRTNLLRRKVFWASYVIILAFQLLVNGVLTGRHLVIYSSHDIIGGDSVRFLGDGRICYAPIEDLLFGFSLVLQTLSWWIWWGGRLALSNAANSPAVRRRTRRS
jgi:lycopene cyclase domain-containing protein